jgi:hypothetical protein
MSNIRKRLVAPMAIAIALSLTPALSGCFGNPVESIIEGATGGDVDLGGAGLPDGFPTSDVPLIDGEITYGLTLGKGADRVWTVIIRVDDLSAFEDIAAQLEGAGFEQSDAFGGTTEGGSTGTFASDKYSVLVSVFEDGEDGFAASYLVATATD